MTIVNKVKSLAARATMNENDVRALLKKDHDDAKKLAEKMCDATQGSRRMALLQQLKPALTAHSRAEESAVYEALLKARSADSRELANEGFVEHSLVDELLTALADNDPATDRWKAQAKVLKELLEHHIEEEQTDIFAELGEHFTEVELIRMGAQFVRHKAMVEDGSASSNQLAIRKIAASKRKAVPPKKAAGRIPATKRAKRASGK